MRIWLASGSPRRRDLLELAGYMLDVRPANIDETRDPGDDPVAHARRLAVAKAASAPADRLVVAADTVVHLGDRIFEKPGSVDEAIAHLSALSGRWHQVTTGVAVRRGIRQQAFTSTTRVRFRELTPGEIARYARSGEGDDKAGAYGIQGTGGFLVAEVQGSWTNVVGLPLEPTIAALRALGDASLEADRGRA